MSGEPRFDADGVFVGYRGIGRDVTEIAIARERIASLAYHDALTGLANRTSLAPALEQAIERTRRHRSKLAGVFMDLDGFKQVNDLPPRRGRRVPAGSGAALCAAACARAMWWRASAATNSSWCSSRCRTHRGRARGEQASPRKCCVRTIWRRESTRLGEPGVSIFPDDAGDAPR